MNSNRWKIYGYADA